MSAIAARIDSWDDVAAWLRERRTEQGMPTYRDLVRMVRDVRVARGMDPSEAPGRATVYDCFKDGRKRMDVTLVADLGRALGLSGDEAHQLEHACFAVQNRLEASRVVSVTEQLPQTPYFVGRREELDRLAADPERQWLISGMAGVGKTQLALRAAKAMVDDGTADRLLVADLRGFDRSRPPADGEAMLDELLRTTTGSLTARTQPLAERRRQLADALAEHRIVLVLDDAASNEQVRTIVDDEPTSPVLVTSRLQLELPGAAQLPLSGLSPDDGMALLGALVPATRLAEEQDAAREIVAHTVGHPLTLDLAAGQIAGSGWSLADHAHRLASQASRLRLPGNVEEQLELSVRALSAPAHVLLRRLAVTPCTDLGAEAIGVLADADVDDALAELVTGNLLMCQRGRYSLHDLVRLYAGQQAEELDSVSDRAAALSRLLENYLLRVREMVTALGAGVFPRVAPDRFQPLASEVTPEQARAWFVAERENIAVLTSLEETPPETVYALAATVSNWYDTTGWFDDAALLLQRALDVAESHGDRRAAAEAGALLGSPLGRFGDPRAAEVLTAALANPDIDPYARISALTGMVLHENRRGSLQRALDHAFEALQLVEAGLVERPRANLLGNVASLLGRAERLEEAVKYGRLTLEAALEEGDLVMAAIAASNLSPVMRELGDLEGAVAAAEEGIAIAVAEQFDMILGPARSNLGLALAALGRFEEAVDAHRAAIDGVRQRGERDMESSCVNDLADTYLVAGEVERARECVVEALALALEVADFNEIGRAHEYLGRLALLDADPTTARVEFEQALQAFEEGQYAADVARVGGRLAGLAVSDGA